MKEKQVQAFLDAYSDFKEMQDWEFSIQFYHNNEMGCPTFSSQTHIDKLILDYVEDDFVITIFTEDNIYSFDSSNWLAFVGSEYVSFGSRHSDETHWIIEYC